MKLFAVQGPFSFEGQFRPREGVTEHRKASGIWLKSGSQIGSYEAIYWSQCSGRMDELETREIFDSGPLQDRRGGLPFAWFVANRCFVLQLIANPEKDEMEESKKFGFEREAFLLTLSHGATAEVRHYTRYYKPGVLRETKKMGYSIHVRGFKQADQCKADVDALLILASFASRERSLSSYWSSDMVREESIAYWRLNVGKLPSRPDREDPLIIRDRDACQRFIQKAFDVYSRAQHKELLNSAIYALLATEMPLEIRIVRLFAGIQGAMMFALQELRGPKRPTIDALYRKVSKRWPTAFDDLWPLLDPRSGPSLARIRHAIAHGEAFSETDFLALSYADENLRWHLERLILLSLEWDIQESTVSSQYLNRFYGYRWQTEQKKLQV